jgi:serine phosphatase RsbU (regulator of sigma subunit)
MIGHDIKTLQNLTVARTHHFVENGLFLGLFPQATNTAIEFPSNAGDWGLLYTDGTSENTASSEEQFGLDRCKEFLQEDCGSVIWEIRGRAVRQGI